MNLNETKITAFPKLNNSKIKIGKVNYLAKKFSKIIHKIENLDLKENKEIHGFFNHNIPKSTPNIFSEDKKRITINEQEFSEYNKGPS